MSERHAPGPWAAFSALSRFTVGGQLFLLSLINFNVRKSCSWAQGRLFAHSRFTVGLTFVGARFSTLVPLCGKMAHIQEGDGHVAHHPFHCWARVERESADHFLSRNTQYWQKGQKTLGWPTIFSVLSESTVLRKREYSRDGMSEGQEWQI